jgi:glutamate-ammonia-ligase adenylyltransferase
LIAGFGKLGGREITINSDLDLTFISLSNPNEHITKMAQKILNTLMSYTSEGLSYKVDTRLRPDGSKGILAHGMTGLRDYYLYKAQIWEVQALLKARPITSQNASQFLSLIREIIDKRGHQIMPDDIISMRAKIKKEHFNASLSYEIKLGDGGIQDIEFLVQYLELRNGIAVQNTIAAIGRLCRQNIIDSAQTKILIDSYLFQRTVESFIRLRGLEKKITNNKDALIDALTIFFDYDNNGKFLAFLDTHKCKTIETIKRLLK